MKYLKIPDRHYDTIIETLEIDSKSGACDLGLRSEITAALNSIQEIERPPNRKSAKVCCPRCDGEGEEPGAPIDLKSGTALCDLCHGRREVTAKQAKQYQEEQS